MSKACSRWWDSLIEVAEGHGSAEAISHAESCSGCRDALNQLRGMFASMSADRLEAPEGLIRRAVALFPAPVRRRARLLRNPQLAIGLRGSREAFQLTFEAEEVQVRMMYTPSPEGWQVTGKVSDTECLPYRPALTVLEPGWFEFEAKDLIQTGLTLMREGEWIDVPSAEEATDRNDE